MKGIKLILTVFVVLIGLTVSAQENHKKSSKSDKMALELGLDEKQKAEVVLILAESKKEMKALRANEVLGEVEKKKAKKAIQDSKENKLSSVFTEEQSKLYHDLKKKRAEVKKEGRQDRMAERLDLTENQGLEIEAIKEKAKGERRAITSNTYLTKEQKSKQLKQVRRKMDAQTKEVLTEEQYVKMKAIKQEKRTEKSSSREKK